MWRPVILTSPFCWGKCSLPLIIVYLVVAQATVRAGTGPIPPGQQAAHLRFDETMIVAWNQEGVVAIVFELPESADSLGAAPMLVYRWRTNDEKSSGEGFLPTDGSEQILSVPHVHLKVKCAPKRGTLFYDPRAVAVHPIKSTLYGTQDLGPPGVPKQRAPADLDHFLHSDKEIQDWFRKRKYSGQSTQPGYPRHPLPFKIRYFENGLVVADPNGVAAFEFLSSVERRSANELRRGVKYRWRFVSVDGKGTQFGEGEVWELYRDDKYIADETLHYLEAGPIHIPWSINDLEAGWIYYEPAWQSAWFVAPEAASNLVSRDGSSEELSKFRFGPRPLRRPAN